jgi:hypothetical protein
MQLLAPDMRLADQSYRQPLIPESSRWTLVANLLLSSLLEKLCSIFRSQRRDLRF